MEKKLLYLTFGILIGIIISYYFIPELNFIIIILFILLYFKFEERYFRYSAFGLFIILIPLLFQKYTYISFLNGSNISLEGKVVKTYSRYDNYQRIEVRSFVVNNESITSTFSVATVGRVNFEVGNIVSIDGVVEDVTGYRNFGLTNIAEIQRIKGISNSIKAMDIKLISNGSKIDVFRIKTINYVNDIFDRYLSQENSGVLKKLILADTKSMDYELDELYKNTGISHLFAISGFHILIILYLLNSILNHIGFGYGIKIIFTFVTLSFYGFILGFPPSVSRAVLMYFILIASEQFEKKLNNRVIALISFNILLIFKPYYLFDVGFQLSFGAVFGIVYLKEMLFINTKSELLNAIQTYISVNLAILPFLVVNFNNFNLISLVTNLLMAPIISVVLILSYMGIIANIVVEELSAIIFYGINFIFEAANFYLIQLDNFIKIPIKFQNPDLLFPFIYYIILYSFVDRNMRKILFKERKVILLLFLTAFATNLIQTKTDTITIGFLDVGQGDSSYISYKGKNILIDTGGSIFSTLNPGVVVTERAIEKRCIGGLNVLILSHLDLDHVGGTKSILKKNLASEVVIKEVEKDSEIFFNIFGKDDERLTFLGADSEIIFDENLSIKFLNVSNNNNNYNSNDNSLVCLVSYKDKKILYTGDLTSKIEDELIKKIGKIDLLKVAHHGSGSSTSEDFLKISNPRYSIVSVGKNSYGHPNAEVLERLNNLKSKVLRTDIEGEIIFRINEDISVSTYENSKLNIFSILYTGISVIIVVLIFKDINIRRKNYEIQ